MASQFGYILLQAVDHSSVNTDQHKQVTKQDTGDRMTATYTDASWCEFGNQTPQKNKEPYATSFDKIRLPSSLPVTWLKSE